MRFVCLFFVCALMGCAPAPVKMVDPVALQRSEPFKLQDLRPAIEKEDKTFSLSITSDAYALYRRGDGLTDPAPTRVLQHRLFEKLGAERTSGKTLKVHHFVIYLNMQSFLRRGVILGTLFGGVTGGVMNLSVQNNSVFTNVTFVDRTIFDATGEDEYKRALYTAAENPNKANMLILFLDAEFDGKRIFLRSVAPAVVDAQAPNATSAAVDGIVSAFLNQF